LDAGKSTWDCVVSERRRAGGELSGCEKQAQGAVADDRVEFVGVEGRGRGGRWVGGDDGGGLGGKDVGNKVSRVPLES